MSVFSYKNIENKKCYYFKFSLNARQYCRRGFKTKLAAENAERSFRASLLGDNDPWRVLLKLTYRDALEEYKAHCFKTLKITTASDISRAIDNFYIYCFKPNRYIYQLDGTDAQKAWNFINKLKVSITTKNNKLHFLQRFFSFVQRNYNYYYQQVFMLPNYKDYQIKRIKKKREIIELSELSQLLNKANEYYKLALLTLFIYGYRLGELLGLKVDSIDFKAKTIENYQSVAFKTGNGSYILTSPKTKKSERIRPCSDKYLELIKKHIQIHELKRNDYLFYKLPGIRSEPAHENTFRKALKRLDPGITPHMLRRSLVTHLAERGVPLEEIARYVGHDSIKVTEEYYLKKSKEKSKRLNSLIDELIQEEEGRHGKK